MKRFFKKLVLPVIVVGAVLSGCASGTAPSSSAPATPAPDAVAAPAKTAEAAPPVEAPATETDSAQPEDVKLSFTWWGSQTRHDYTQKLTDMYAAENPGITFENSPAGWDGYFEKLSTQAASGTMPDIIQMDYLYISTYAQNNTLADMQPFVDSGVLDLSQVDQTLVNSGAVNGKLVGVVGSSSVLTFPYNPAVLSEAGVAEPTSAWTWDDFMNDCLQVKANTGKYGFSSNPIDTNLLNYWVRQTGQPLFAPDNKSLGYSDDAVFAGFADMYKKLVDAGAAPNPDQWAQINSLSKEAGPVVTGDAAFTTEWSNYGVVVAANNPDIKLMTPPYAENGTKALWIKPGMFFSIAENSQHKEEAAKFINWLVNSEEANDVMMGERGVPVSATIRESLKSKLDQQSQDMFTYTDEALSHSEQVPPPDPQGISEINALLVDTIAEVLYGQATPDDAAISFRTDANAILARNN